MKIRFFLIMVFCLATSSTFAYHAEKNYEYIDFPGTKTVEQIDGGYVFHMLDGSEIYLDEFGQIIEDMTNSIQPDDDKDNDKSQNIQIDGFRVIEVIGEKGAVVEDRETGLLGVVTLDGKEIFPAKYKQIVTEESLLWMLNDEGSRSVIAHIDGKIIEKQGWFVTGIGDNGWVGISAYNELENKDADRFIDLDGNTMLTIPDGYNIQTGFSEGKASVVSNIVYGRFGSTSYINENNETVVEQIDDINNWTMGGEFKNNIAVVGVGLGKAGSRGRLLIRYIGDTPSDWAKTEVEKAIGSGYVPEGMQGLYRNTVSREEFCEITANMLEKVGKLSEQAKNAPSPFSDTESRAVAALHYLGIIDGCPVWSRGMGERVLFCGEDKVHREQAAKILTKTFEIMYGEIIDEVVTLPKYEDDTEISDWAKQYVYKATAKKILQGEPGTKIAVSYFYPGNGFTREQVIVTMQRLLQIAQNKD